MTIQLWSIVIIKTTHITCCLHVQSQSIIRCTLVRTFFQNCRQLSLLLFILFAFRDVYLFQASFLSFPDSSFILFPLKFCVANLNCNYTVIFDLKSTLFQSFLAILTQVNKNDNDSHNHDEWDHCYKNQKNHSPDWCRWTWSCRCLRNGEAKVIRSRIRLVQKNLHRSIKVDVWISFLPRKWGIQSINGRSNTALRLIPIVLIDGFHLTYTRWWQNLSTVW